MALNYTYTDREGEVRTSVDYVDVSVWGGLVTVVQNYCHKGKQVLVSGRLKSSSWEKDGQTRSKLEVRAEHLLLLGSGSPADESIPSPTAEDSKKTTSKKPATSQSKTKAEKSTEKVDYELEDFDYDQEEIDPQDIPF